MGGDPRKLRDFCIPAYILVQESEREEVAEAPSCPVIVFVNARSGGQLGGDLIKSYRELLNEVQVLQ